MYTSAMGVYYLYMSNPTADYPTALHSRIDTSGFDNQYLGVTTPVHTDVHGKLEEEVYAAQVKLGLGASPASSAALNAVLVKGATDTSWAVLTTDQVTQGSNLYSQWETDTGGIIYNDGHIAVGSSADVNGTGPVNSALQDAFGTPGTVDTVVGIQEVHTGTPKLFNTGLMIKHIADYSSDPTSFFGIENTVATAAGNAQNITVSGGIYNSLIHRGTGTISLAYASPNSLQNTSSGNLGNGFGVFGAVANSGSGAISNAFVIYSEVVSNTGGGTITNVFGLNISAQTAGVNNYGASIGSASTQTLWVGSDADNTISAAGLAAGISRDILLYRSAVSTWRTNGNIIVDAAGTAANSVATIDATQTLTNKRITKRIQTASDATSITPTGDSADLVKQTNTQAAGTLTINAPTGTPTDGQELILRIKSTNVQTFSFNATYRGSLDTPLPVSTYASSTTCYMKFMYNSTDTKWDCVALTDGY